jgi:hypothetical protein
MTTLLNILIFLLGMCLCVQCIAALYGIIDLWYTIRTTYPRVIRRVLFWAIVCLAIAWLMGEDWRPVFFWGFVGYIGFYVISFWGYQLLFRRNLSLLGIKHPFKKDGFRF